MTIQKHYLITTAEEQTWRFDCPVIFLGEWCRLYKHKHIWHKMNADVMKPYGVELSKKKKDYHEAKIIEDKLFPEFCDLLNQHHGKQYPNRFWLIFVGPWFKKIIKLLINRVNSIKECLDTYEISGTTIYDDNFYSLFSVDYLDAEKLFNDNQWNNILYFRILEMLKEIKFPVEVIKKDTNNNSYTNFKLKSLSNKISANQKFRKWALKFYNKVAIKFIREDDAFILSSYLPLKEVTKLELFFGQFPQLWHLRWNKTTSPRVNNKPDKLIRENLKKKFTQKPENNLETIVRSLLFELLPTCYLEGYKDLTKIANEQPWPKSPKFIFTSVNYNADDIFKLWVAKRVAVGSNYYIGQHGNSYGTRWDLADCIEEITPDKFITWGWTDGSPKHFPAFVFNSTGKKIKNYSSHGGLLLIETIKMHPFTTYDSSIYFKKYLEDQKNFVSCLDSKPRQKLTIRLHAGYADNNYGEDIMWSDFDSSIKINDGRSDITSLISKNRLMVYSYDSTGILITLSQNIPTLAFWNDGLDHLRESAKPYYQMLVDAGIIHLSNESASNKVNEIWDDVDGWWNQNHIQDARIQFCQRYAKTSQKPISEIKKILLS